MVGFARPPVCLHLCHYLFSPVCMFVYLLHLLCLSVDLFHVYLYVSFLSFKHAICLGLPLNLCNSHTVNKLFPIRLLFISPCHRSQMPINGCQTPICFLLHHLTFKCPTYLIDRSGANPIKIFTP